MTKWYMPKNQIGSYMRVYKFKKDAIEDFRKDDLDCNGFIILVETKSAGVGK